MKVIPTLSLCTTFACVFASTIPQAADLEIQRREVSDCGNFSSSCEYVGVEVKDGQVLLEAGCIGTTPQEPLSLTKLDLNRCVGSVKGKLVGKQQGDLLNTCKDITYSKPMLSAECDDSGHRSDFNLDEVVGNGDSQLCCFGYHA
ncbi:hypothetical protein O1611_g1497 [Lasiodiplodia mahajangana]|uniref:Uncharacterized protein n=1 Tax=Lasiodiplodia mahajangana TaxID=1108764 RepID=A0ACC2JX89_9PEZI|nr:hypothetical protein O1611_g1497 [Lasiodiplodia mahajangana]